MVTPSTGCKAGILTNEGIIPTYWLIPGQIYPPRTYVCQGTRFIHGMSLGGSHSTSYIWEGAFIWTVEYDVDLAGVGP